MFVAIRNTVMIGTTIISRTNLLEGLIPRVINRRTPIDQSAGKIGIAKYERVNPNTFVSKSCDNTSIALPIIQKILKSPRRKKANAPLTFLFLKKRMQTYIEKRNAIPFCIRKN